MSPSLPRAAGVAPPDVLERRRRVVLYNCGLLLVATYVALYVVPARYNLVSLPVVITAVSTLVAAVVAKVFAKTNAKADAASHAMVLSSLKSRLVTAESEATILSACCTSLLDLHPCLLACAACSKADGPYGTVTLEVQGTSSAELRGALPVSIFSDAGSSVVSAMAHHDGVVDSAEHPGTWRGRHSDWHAAASLDAGRAVTMILHAGVTPVGFMVLYLPKKNARPVIDSTLKAICAAVGGALFVRTACGLSTQHALPGRRDGDPLSRPPSRRSSLNLLTYIPLPSVADTELEMQHRLSTAENMGFVEMLRDWDFDPETFDDATLQRLLVTMVSSLGLLRACQVEVQAFETFVDLARQHYTGEGTFHTWRHAFTVTHVAWRFLDRDDMQRYGLKPLDKLALLLAALCHDLEHPGKTNAFMVNSGSPQALRFNDVSVLENQSALVGWELVTESEMLLHMQQSMRVKLRKLMLRAILDTDMSRHKLVLAQMHTAFPGNTHGQTDRCPLVPFETRSLLVAFLLHTADLSCPLMTPALNRRLVSNLEAEYEAQAAFEVEHKMPRTTITPNGPRQAALSEMNFIMFVAAPLYKTLADISADLGGECLVRLEANRKAWELMAEEDGEGPD